MKTGVLRVLGVWVLLGAMVFALVRVDTAAEWVGWWIPVVALGMGLLFVAKRVGKKREPSARE